MTNNDIIPEKADKSQEVETHLNGHLIIARVEINFEKLPIWSTKPKRTTVFTPSKTIKLEPEKLPDGQLIQRRIEIVPSAKYGYPTTQTQEYWYALQKLWHKSSTREAGRIEFSRRQILVDILGKAYGKKQVQALELSIEQLAGTLFRFDYVFYDKVKDEITKEVRGFSLATDYHFTSKETKSDIVHNKCTVTLHPLVVSNLRSGYFKPILLSVISQLKSDIARLLYRKLDSQFSYYNKYEISTERFFREQVLLGNDYKYPSARKRLLERAIQELINKPTSSGAVITSYEFAKTVDGKDWKIIIRATKGKQISTPYAGFPDENEEVIKVAEESYSKRGSEVENPVSHKSKKGDSQPANTETLDLLHYFSSIFHDKEEDDYPKKSIDAAKKAITKYGLKTCKQLVIYAKGEARVSNFAPLYFQAITKFFKAGYEELQRRERIDKLNSEKLATQREKNARCDHEKEFRNDYQDYMTELVEALNTTHPEELNAFQEWEAEQKANALKGKSGDLLRLTERVFDSKGQRFRRLVEYFKRDSRIKTLDFWEWDKEVNPNGYQSLQ